MFFPRHWLHCKMSSIMCYMSCNPFILVLTWRDPIWKSVQRCVFTEIFCRFLQNNRCFHKTLFSPEAHSHFRILMRNKMRCYQIFLNLDLGNLPQLTMPEETYPQRSCSLVAAMPLPGVNALQNWDNNGYSTYIQLATVFIGSTNSCEKSSSLCNDWVEKFCLLISSALMWERNTGPCVKTER